MKISKIILLWFLMISIIMALSSSSFFFLWTCLEVNMMSFIPMMNLKTLSSTNSMMQYFVIQALASSLFIFFLINISINPKLMTNILSVAIISSMLIKVGAVPFHVWFPQVSEGLSYYSFLILSTVQKMIPLQIISMFTNNLILLSSILSAVVGSYGGLSQFSTRKILAFSSITHLAWMLSLTYLKSNLWIHYLLIYFVIMVFITKLLNFYNFNNFNQISLLPKEVSIHSFILFLSLGGMPPMVGFFMKWLTLKILLLNIQILSIPLILSSLVNLFFYTRLMYPIFLKNFTNFKWTTSSSNSLTSFLLTQLALIFMLIPSI
uniref:NADH-ubiquinone oxidoreductase chain 2 n=1 Tax=Ornithodoros hermsi TaxID=303297 RepID=A0A3G2K013_9ACAR|nr:NADH dehydrogenase subunit 2 [Ornithodoros hermsi]AYN50637.1 NADH dehydrogenase subunit 2 [Ornithodoros hermsi]